MNNSNSMLFVVVVACSKVRNVRAVCGEKDSMLLKSAENQSVQLTFSLRLSVSWRAACTAAGLLGALCRRVAEKELRSGFVVARRSVTTNTRSLVKVPRKRCCLSRGREREHLLRGERGVTRPGVVRW